MKHKNILRLSISLVATVFLTFGTFAQLTTYKASDNSPSNTDMGFYYTLPQTTFKIELIYEEVKSIKGPLASYATEFLGITDIITGNSSDYNLIDVKVSSIIEMDPDQIYFVRFPVERAKDSKPDNFFLSDIGGLLAYNTNPAEDDFVQVNENNINYYYDSGDEDFAYQSQYNKRKKTDTIRRQINIDTVVIDRFIFNTTWVDKTQEDQAKEAAQQIEKIRESRYNLISGYHEINYGESIVYMDNQLKKMERNYLELFTGKTQKTLKKETIFITPKTDLRSKEILSFNNGKSVFLTISNDKSDKMPNTPESSANSVYYRIPSRSTLKIDFSGEEYFIDQFMVNQLGNVFSVPLKNSKIRFNRETGNVTSFYQE